MDNTIGSNEAELTVVRRKLIKEIRRLKKTGCALDIESVREDSPAILRRVYKIRPFWGWKRALESSGYEYPEDIPWKPNVTCEICGARLKNLTPHLALKHGVSWGEYRESYSEDHMVVPCRTRVRKRERIRARDGRMILHWESHWSPEYVLDRVFELHAKNVDICPSVVERCEPQLYESAFRFFGGWNQVLLTVGIDPACIRRVRSKKMWTRRQVLDEIKSRFASGKPLSWSRLTKDDRSLSNASLKFFGAYDKALRAAGIDPAEVRLIPVPKNPYKTKDAVLCAIHKRRRNNAGLSSTDLSRGEHRDFALYNKARRLFGSWRKAIDVAGIDYGEATRDPVNPYTTKGHVLDELRKRHENGLPLIVRGVRSGRHRNNALYESALRFFGSWPTAVEAAGIDYKSLGPRSGKYPTPGAVIAEIQRRHRENLPLNAVALDKQASPHMDKALYMRALRAFGSWRAAIESAGIPYVSVMRRRKYQTKDSVIAGIRRRMEEGKSLRYSGVNRGADKDRPLGYAAEKEFGRWSVAVAAARALAGADDDEEKTESSFLRSIGVHGIEDMVELGFLAESDGRVLVGHGVLTVENLLNVDEERIASVPERSTSVVRRIMKARDLFVSLSDCHQKPLPHPKAAIKELEGFCGGMSGIVRRALSAVGVNTVEDILKIHDKDLNTIRHFGSKSSGTIELLRRIARLCREAHKGSSGFMELCRTRPVTEKTLAQLPLFSDRPAGNLHPEELHESYAADLRIDTLPLPVRAEHVIERAQLCTLGELLMFPGSVLIGVRSCGVGTVSAIRSEVKRFLLNADSLYVDMSSYNNMVRSYVEICVRNRVSRKVALRRLLTDENDRISTLKGVGKEFGCSRENVRLIQRKVGKVLDRESNSRHLSRFWTVVEDILAEHNGCVIVSDLADGLKERLSWPSAPHPKSLCLFLAHRASLRVDLAAGVITLKTSDANPRSIQEEIQ